MMVDTTKLHAKHQMHQITYAAELIKRMAVWYSHKQRFMKSVLLPQQHVAKFSFTHDRMTQTFTMNFQHYKMLNQNLYQ